MDEQNQTGASWWENTLDFVVRAAAAKQFAAPQLQNGQSYYVDQAGNVLPMGAYASAGSAQIANAATSNRWVMLAGLALAGVLLYKLVK